MFIERNGKLFWVDLRTFEKKEVDTSTLQYINYLVSRKPKK